MALATQCPHCHTTFRVAHDQLKLRAGIVRCGSCKQIFNGVEHLLPPDAVQSTDITGIPQYPETVAGGGKIDPYQPPVASVASASYGSQHDGEMTFKPFQAIVTGTSAKSAPEIPSEAPTSIAPQQTASTDAIDPNLAQAEYEALEQMTQKHFIEAEQPWEDIPLTPSASEQPSSSIGIADADLATVPEERPEYAQPVEETATPGIVQSGTDDAAPSVPDGMNGVSTAPVLVTDEAANDHASDEPDFVKRGRLQPRYKQTRQLLFGIGTLLLLIGAMGQATYTFRNQIAARMPQSKPALIAACAIAGCKIEWPAQIELLTIESSELQALPNSNNAFSLTLLLRNHGTTTGAWPNIQLTLNDENERAVARRIFAPREYLGSAAEIDRGFPSNAEQSAKVFFTLTQLKASGYRVYLFYP